MTLVKPYARKRRGFYRSLAVLNGAVLFLAACSVTEGRVTMVGGPPRVAVVNSVVKPSKVIEGTVEHIADGDCWVLQEDDTQYALAWPMNSEGGYSANEKPGVYLESGATVMSQDTVVASGELDLPGSEQAANLPEVSELCGADDGGWLLLADIDVG